MIRLNVLGGALLRRDGLPVDGRAAQRHHLGLLAFLAAAPGRSATRDKLIAVLWPESDAARARHRLSVALHVLRRDLGADCITTSGDAVALNPTVVWSDVGAFRDAVAEGRLEDAVAHCGGAFLDGFFLGGAPDFDAWVEGERERLAGLYRAVLERLIAEAEEAGDAASTMNWWRRLATLDPHSAPVAVGLMRASAASGDLAGAVRHARAYAALIEGELGVPADPRVVALADELMKASEERPAHAGAIAATVELELVEAGRSTEPSAHPPPGSTPRDAPFHQPTSAPLRRERTRKRTVGGLVAGGAALATLLALGARLALPDGRGEAGVGVAVIASHTTDAGPGDEALAERLAADVRATLAWVPDLRVAAGATRTSGTRAELQRIGKRLRVSEVLELRVHHDESRAYVEARLVDADTAAISWSGSWARPVGDTAHLDDELSLTIAEAVRLRIAPYRPKVYTESERAYDRFLEGVYEHRRLTRESLWAALQYYREAWEEDPGFALAHAIAGNAYIHLTILGAPTRVPFARAGQHVQTALELDSTLAEAHAARGYLRIFADHDFAGGERSLRKAIMLYPTLPQAHDWYGRYALYVRGWPDVAIARARRALEVDPLNTGRSHLVEWILYLARRYEDVPEQNRVTWSLDGDVARSLTTSPLAEAYRELGRYDEAIAEFEALQDRSGAPRSSGLAVTYARVGRVELARAILHDLERRLEEGGGSPVAVASIYANLGDTDRALALLEEGVDAHPDEFVLLRVDPVLDPLREDPRFDALLRRVGLD